ncbi:MAG: SDR family oxidoreductase [Actinomycetota bacterium]
MKVLVTGATGSLGTQLTPALARAGHAVRALSRRPQPPGEIEWIRGDLRTGDGVEAAVQGVDAIVHAATLGGFEGGKTRMRRAFIHSPRTDVHGTSRLLDAAKRAGAPRVVYVSIVGIEKVPMSYYRHKLQAEELVRTSGLPFTIARVVQFHSLIDGLCRYAARFPIAVLPLRVLYQPIDERDAGSLVAGLVDRDPSNATMELGGPEVRTMGELAEAWATSRGVRKRFRNMPMPGAKAMAAGAHCTEDRSGTITWEQWLKEKIA